MDGGSDSFFVLSEEGQLHVVVDFIEVFYPVDEEVAVLDVLVFEELSSLADGVAVDERVAGLHFEVV